ncbi:MAG: extracellular solute-binding protein [Candidatus Kapaibacterium sp.]
MTKLRTVSIVVMLCVACIGLSCNSHSSPSKTTITLWHFWSEPRQKQALMTLITQFEKLHPTIHVELTDLQWSDGKTKLMLGFNSRTAPDVVHLGFEWMPEFIASGALSPLSDSLAQDTSRYFSPALQSLTTQAHIYALPWTMNTRAMVISRKLIPNVDSFPARTKLDYGKYTWDMLRAMKKQRGTAGFWGINSAEPHNVLKKALPVIWSAGSTLFTKNPLSSTFDPAAVMGLEFYLELCDGGTQEQSRTLDDKLLQGKIGAWITGQWLLDKAHEIHEDTAFVVLGQIPTSDIGFTGYSILGGDCLARSSQSTHSREAELLIQFLTSYPQSSAFCKTVSDAGFPADKAVFSPHTAAQYSDHQLNFLEQVRNARPLPASPHFLDAERILEEEIMNAVYRKKSAREALEAARRRIVEVEMGGK